MNKSKEQASVRRPETIELWVQLTGKKLFWWEPLGDSGSFVVCDSEATEYIVRQNDGEIEFRQISRQENEMSVFEVAGICYALTAVVAIYGIRVAPLRDDIDD